MLVRVLVQVRAAMIGEVNIPDRLATGIEFSRLWVGTLPPPLCTQLRVSPFSFGIVHRCPMLVVPGERPTRKCCTGSWFLSGTGAAGIAASSGSSTESG